MDAASWEPRPCMKACPGPSCRPAPLGVDRREVQGAAMRTVTRCALLLAFLCCCQKAADKTAPPLPQRPNAALKTAMWSMVASTSALSELLGKAAAPSAEEIGQARRLVDEVHHTVSALAADHASRAH